MKPIKNRVFFFLRVLGGAILGVTAYVAGGIGYGAVADAIANPYFSNLHKCA